MTPSRCISSWFPHCITSCHGNTRNVAERLDCVGPLSPSRTSPVHIVLSCVLLLTMNSADGSLLELAAACLDLLGLLDSPWASPLLLFDSTLPLCFDWPTFSESGILVMAVPLPCSLLALPPLDLALLALDFLDLPSLSSGDFSCCGGVLLGWGGVTGGCGWAAGGLILVAVLVRLVCGTVWLSVRTSVRLSSSVCSLAKLTKTWKKLSQPTVELFDQCRDKNLNRSDPSLHTLTLKNRQSDIWLRFKAFLFFLWNLSPSCNEMKCKINGIYFTAATAATTLNTKVAARLALASLPLSHHVFSRRCWLVMPRQDWLETLGWI